MRNTSKGITIGLIIVSFFLLMSKMDFIVHRTLYNHGLVFSYEWALEYWAIYVSIFVAFSVMISSIYWLGSNKSSKDLEFSIGTFASVNLLMIGGLQDIMFFIFWADGLPLTGVTWWWSPWVYVFGTWNTTMQIALALASTCVVIVLWVILTKGRGLRVRKRKEY